MTTADPPPVRESAPQEQPRSFELRSQRELLLQVMLSQASQVLRQQRHGA
ncbi:MAG: hypothetical protein VKJ87_05865 [Synechococcus sp.]|nr:hypothetical protein [Synechococcus sp.]